MGAIVDAGCAGCRACCHDDLILIHPELGDDPADYLTEPLTLDGKQVLALRKQENDDCIYLGPDGCTIHGRHPAVCREFHCGRLYQALTRAQRRAAMARGQLSRAVLDAGRRRSGDL